jgi:hypothetical protein
MADDEFDIDIYGDTNAEQETEGTLTETPAGDMNVDDLEPVNGHASETNGMMKSKMMIMSTLKPVTMYRSSR